MQDLARIIGGYGMVLSGLVLDFNCKFSAHAKNHWCNAFKGIVFLIGWLHSKSGHKLECQLGFSSMYRPGTGRLVGENMEQVWVSSNDYGRRGPYWFNLHQSIDLNVG